MACGSAPGADVWATVVRLTPRARTSPKESGEIRRRCILASFCRRVGSETRSWHKYERVRQVSSDEAPIVRVGLERGENSATANAVPDFLRQVLQFSNTVHFSDGHLSRRHKEMIASHVSYLKPVPVLTGQPCLLPAGSGSHRSNVYRQSSK